INYISNMRRIDNELTNGHGSPVRRNSTPVRSSPRLAAKFAEQSPKPIRRNNTTTNFDHLLQEDNTNLLGIVCDNSNTTTFTLRNLDETTEFMLAVPPSTISPNELDKDITNVQEHDMSIVEDMSLDEQDLQDLQDIENAISNVIETHLLHGGGVGTGTVNYSYSGDTGPQFWHLLDNSDKICSTGKNQSPIDLTSEDIKNYASPPYPNFTDITEVKAYNDGHTVECSSDDMSKISITVDGKIYTLSQFHFHTPSEHRINGKYFDVEQHLVFQSEDGLNAVVGVFYDMSSKNSTFMAPIIENVRSLTTPPCTESVTWFVNVNPLNIGMQQVIELRDVIGFNSRYCQKRY
ncbi:1865_t:CDS:2, partial [Diversispora eburnea]